MKNLRNIKLVMVPAVVALALTGCGGGSDQASNGGTGGSGISTGTISGFGSVFVNGVEYETSGADITLDGGSGTEDDLRVGMVVKLSGSVDANGATGTATRIEFEDNVEGIVDSVDAGNNTLVVMGQTVIVDNMTSFEGTTLVTLSAGNIVEVSGWADAGGDIHATYIELEKQAFTQGVDELELMGKVSNLDSNQSTFDLGSLKVTYASAQLKDLPNGLSDGLMVEVKSLQGLNGDGELVASEVEGKSDDLEAAEDDEVEIEGMITQVTSSSEFRVNGHEIMTDDQTRYERGSAADISVDVRVEVEGHADSNGVLVAEEIKFEHDGHIKLEADIEAVDSANGIVTVLGNNIKLTNNTQLKDESASEVRYFDIGDLAIGDRVEIEGYMGESAIVATKLEREDGESDDGVEVQGILNTVNDPNLELLGLSIATGMTTSFSRDDAAMTADEFFTAVQSGDVVSVEGTLNGDGTISAAEVEIEDES